MKVLEGLAGLKSASKGGERKESSFLKLEDGGSVRVRFLQELDKTGKYFDDTRGTAKAFFEHTNPANARQRFVCSRDDGNCLGCEMAVKNPQWRARPRIYLNALLRAADGEAEKVKIISQGLSEKAIGKALVEFADEFGTICDRDYKIRREGEGIATRHSLLPLGESPPKKSEKDIEVLDFMKYIHNLTYEEQVDLVNNKESDSW